VFRVLKPGLETCIQDYPGRVGGLRFAFPRSGPMDDWSFRLANVLVGNAPGAAALECQFLGPTLEFLRDTVVAIAGADMQAQLDGERFPLHESVAVRAGQVLEFKAAIVGVRTYVAMAGGIAAPTFLGSKSTFRKAGIGGIDGGPLRSQMTIPLGSGSGSGSAGRRAAQASVPPVSSAGPWEVEVLRGPNDDWILPDCLDEFLSARWSMAAQSDRMGIRLVGDLTWRFAPKAIHKAPEHGTDPSNIIDQEYPPGAINVAGQTPIVLGRDGPTAGGFVCPFTVPRCAFWKLGQMKPRDALRFREIRLEEALERARRISRAIAECASLDS
jgi:urea carboxylase